MNKILNFAVLAGLNSSGGGASLNDKGWFVNEAALIAAYPVGQNGWYAIIGDTDTVWIWDGDTAAWVNSGASATGDVTGSASSTDNNVTVFDGTTGKAIKDSGLALTVLGSSILQTNTNTTAISNLNKQVTGYVTVRAGTNAGDYETVYDAVQDGNQYIYIDGLTPVVETNDITSFGDTTVTDDIFIIGLGTWKPKRYMASATHKLVLTAKNGPSSFTIQQQNPASVAVQEFFGRSTSTGTETNHTFADGIIFDNSLMTADNYGVIKPTGTFIARNVKVLLPNKAGNGISWEFNPLNTVSECQGIFEIVGGGSSCARIFGPGNDLKFEGGIEISGQVIKNQALADVLTGSAAIWSDPGNYPKIFLDKINWNLSNLIATDSIDLVISGEISNIDIPSNQTNSTQAELNIYSANDNSTYSNIDFNGGKFVQLANGYKNIFKNCKNLTKLEINYVTTEADCENWHFDKCEFLGIDYVKLAILTPKATFNSCHFEYGAKISSFGLLSPLFNNCTTGIRETTLTSDALVNATSIVVADSSIFAIGEFISIIYSTSPTPPQISVERVKIVNKFGTTIDLAAPLANAATAGSKVGEPSGLSFNSIDPNIKTMAKINNCTIEGPIEGVDFSYPIISESSINISEFSDPSGNGIEIQGGSPGPQIIANNIVRGAILASADLNTINYPNITY